MCIFQQVIHSIKLKQFSKDNDGLALMYVCKIGLVTSHDKRELPRVISENILGFLAHLCTLPFGDQISPPRLPLLLLSLDTHENFTEDSAVRQR